MAWMDARSNRLAELSERNSHSALVVRIYDTRETTGLRLLSDIVTQQVICFGK